MKQIITIGREFGSGGRTIGKMVANRLGLAYYDREIIDEAAKKSGLSSRYIEENEQRNPGSLLYSLAMGGFYGHGNMQLGGGQAAPLSEQIYKAQKEAITALADKGPCVIVGRCADYILKDREDLLRVFVYASMEKRLERAVREYGMSETDARREMERSDKARARHYTDFTDQTWGARQNYDCLLNSGAPGIEACVNSICQYAHMMN